MPSDRLHIKQIALNFRSSLHTKIIPTARHQHAETRGLFRAVLDGRGVTPVQWTAQVLDRVQRAEPATLIQFPVVRANALDECGAVAIREASLLVAFFAAHWGSLGDLFCTVVQDHKSGQLLTALHIPPHRGNLIGGFTSGEEPEALRRDLHSLQSDDTLQLFVQLLGEAIRERRPDFQYVRLWSLLETVAKARECAGRPKHDWNGQVQLTKKGQPFFVQDAADQVYELLREILAPGA